MFTPSSASLSDIRISAVQTTASSPTIRSLAAGTGTKTNASSESADVKAATEESAARPPYKVKKRVNSFHTVDGFVIEIEGRGAADATSPDVKNPKLKGQGVA